VFPAVVCLLVGRQRVHMFRATFCPSSSGAHLNCSCSLRFPYKSRGGCVSSRGLLVSGETTCTHTVSPLTSRPWLETHPPRLLYGNQRLRLQFRCAPDDDGQNVARNMLSRVYTTKSDHGWKHIHLGFYTETRGCDCSSKVLLMMGEILPETCWAAFTRLNNKRFYNWLCICSLFYLNMGCVYLDWMLQDEGDGTLYWR
jgi:hypothetical protein